MILDFKNIVFVVDTFSKKVEWLKREELYLENDKIEILIYCCT